MPGRRALLVYPAIPPTYWSFTHALSFVGKRAVMPPLGLATVAGMLPASWDLKAVDLNVEPLEDEDLLSADLVFLSAMLVQKESFDLVADRCRRLGVPVVAGGPYPTACPEEMESVDYLILGEAETTLPAFLSDFEAGHPHRAYQCTTRPDIDAAALPRFDLFNISAYNMLPIQFSRGCPFDCEFCDITSLFGRIPRTKSPEKFLQELDAAFDTGFRGQIFIVDDNFIGNRVRVVELLERIIIWQEEHRHPFTFSTEASIDLAADDRLLDLLSKAGFQMVFVGLETPVVSSLESAGKRQNLKQNMEEAVRRIQRRGIEVTGGFIVGFDADPPEVFELQKDFIESLAIPVAMVGLLQALPNTQLARRLAAEGRLISASTGNNTIDSALNFLPRLPADFLVSGYRRLLAELYKPANYFRRCLKYLGRIEAQVLPTRIKRIEPVMTLRNMQGLFSSLLRQTFSSYGFRYLGFIVTALLRHPKQVVRIFTQAVQGHHFYVMTKRLLDPPRDTVVG